MKRFIHLHLHSQFSLLDSSLRVKDLVSRAVKFDMPAIALTDHGNILGAVNFFKTAKAAKIKPIIGAELYVAPGSRFDKPDKTKDEYNYNHLVVLVKNKDGYRNLSELITLSFKEGFYRKPRIDKETLLKYREGLLVLSACVQGEIPFKLLQGREDEAYAAARRHREVFGDDFYIEVQKHGLPMQNEVYPKLVALAHDLSIPLVATNDVHYLNPEDADVRDILICIQTNNVLSNPDRPMKKDTEEMYLKSQEQMRNLFPDIPEALDITMDIASKCNFEFQLGSYYLPVFQVPEPENLSIDDYFEKVCREGFETLKPQLIAEGKNLDEYEKRLAYEIEKIREMKFPGYFLIVWDIIRYAKEHDIPVGPGRGSVVGSLVAYVMKITGLDPLQYDLIFERFLNPERVSMPDIDIDFDGDQRDKVIKYIQQKYGEEQTAQIVTFGTMKAKLAIRDIGRVMEIPLNDVNRIAKMIPEGPKVRLEDEIKGNDDLQKEMKAVPETRKLLDYALKLENNIRHTGMHAAGVVIAPRKLTEFMPLYKSRDDIVTQFEKEEVEEVGLLKMDILGLKTLTIIKNILDELKELEGIQLNLDKIPLDDELTYKVFQAGDTDGIFQFESSGMRDYLKRSQPNKLTDLIALNALYRPGPLGSGMAERFVQRKKGAEKVEYLFPELEPALRDTYGIILYQEQVMRISVIIAGFTMAKADEMRKIMGKKRVDKLPAMEEKFLEGAHARGFDKKKAAELFSQMATFAEYGFNKSHSAAYAYLAYQTAYLKAHHPVYFMSANLSSEAEKTTTTSKVLQYISEAKKMGIQVLPPDINKSGEKFRVQSRNAIRFGLQGLKNVGEAAICSILEARRSGGDFTDYSDFITRADLGKVNKSTLESLIKSGAFDSFGLRRRTMFDGLESVMQQGSVLQKRRGAPQLSLFSADEAQKIVIQNEFLHLDEWSEREIIKYEKEIAGLYITHNPLDRFRYDLEKVSNTTIADILAGDFKGEVARVGGVITGVSHRKSKKGAPYGEMYFEDLTGRIKALAFKEKWLQLREVIEEDRPYYLEGRITDPEDPGVFIEELTDLDLFLRKRVRKIIIRIPYSLLDDYFNESFRERLDRHRDSTPYLIVIQANDKHVKIPSADGEGLKPTLAMKKDLESLTGENSVDIIY